MNIITIKVNGHDVKISAQEELTPVYVRELADFIRDLEAKLATEKTTK